MHEIEKLELLENRLVELYVYLYSSPTLIAIEETIRFSQQEGQWDKKRDDLVARIAEYGIVPSEEHSPLMLLSALDEVVADFGQEDAALRVGHSLHNIHGRTWFLIQRPALIKRSKHMEQPAHLRNWVKYHLIVPEAFPPYPSNSQTLTIRIIHASDHMKSLMALDDQPLSIWFGTFTDHVNPYWPEFAEKKCSCERLEDPCKRRESIQKSLETAQKRQAKVVILPELSVCPTLREEILQWLLHNDNDFLLVVPGSFHELDGLSLPFNRTGLYTGKGNKIFQHDKFIPFGHEMICNELISLGNTVTLWVTPIGIFSLAICRDFCESEGWVRTLWETLAPDWVFVPSMSHGGGMSAHLKQAQHLHDNCGTRVMVANQWPKQPYPKGVINKHGFAFPKPGGERGAQSVSDTPSGRLKKLDLPGKKDDKSIV